MGKADGELIDSQSEASKVLEAALQQMDGFINGVKLDTGDIPSLSSSSRAITEIAEELSKAISESSYLPSLPSPNVALILQKWINQNCKMIEAKRRGNIVSAMARLESKQESDYRKNKNGYQKRDESSSLENSESSDAQEKESETDSEKEHGYELEDINNCSLKTIREEREKGSESAMKKPSGGNDSSPEESTIKQTWSGSISPDVLSSRSDFTSTEDEEEDSRRRKGLRGENDRNRKRNSITKDCNSDFHWVISEKQPESKPVFDTGQQSDKEAQPRKFSDECSTKNPEPSSLYSVDRGRKSANYVTLEETLKIGNPVQFRLPPQSPGSLDRKRLQKSRLERDQKSKSSIISRSPQPPRKTQGRSFAEETNFSSFPESKKHDYFYSHDDWQNSFSEENDKCCHIRNSCGGHGCCGDYYGYHHHHRQVYLPPCRSYYGSCESLQLSEKPGRKNSFGSQKNLVEERKSPRKSLWQDCQQRLFHGSNEYLSTNCCQVDGEKSYFWRTLGKNGPELEEKLIRLENDKESLQLQVSVLTEQVEAQSEKISDLQQSLEDKKQQLTNTEDLLQREILTRSSLETQKLELMSAISELKLQQAAMEKENYELKEEKKRLQIVKPPMMPRNTSPALLQSSSRFSPSEYSAGRKSSNPSTNQELYHSDSSPSQPNSFSDSHHKYFISSTPNNKILVSTSPGFGGISHQKDNIKYYSSSPQPNLRRSMDQYNSLPRQKLVENQEGNKTSEGGGKGVAFGKGLTSLITLKSEKSYSAPNLAETEKSIGDVIENTRNDVEAPKQSDYSQETRKGIKKIFNKIKRSNSGNVNDLLGDGEFKRGGIRATAGPRLGGHIVPVYIPPDKPFAEWDNEALCGWLEELGLENYVADLRRWVKSGSQLLGSSPHDLEKELGMKNHLHKKKLLLALQEMNEKSAESDELLKPAGYLDTAWVMRWLDDVGLPQHKEVFLTARIDGRMLHRLTMDDLATMHINSALHVASLKKGIKVLREHKMDPNCLTRRSVPDEPPPTASEVALWTNHRVMEWLRVVDLAEYAPNLRGSGVHGALMVYETKFTAELLASLLNIPPNKTLLRRHLNTHFKELLGRDVIQAKREAETTLGYIPLTPSAKVKTVKKQQFTLKRKKNKSDVDFGDLVCPLEDGASGENCTPYKTYMSVKPGEGEMKEKRHVPDVCPLTDPYPRESPPAPMKSKIL